MYFGAQDTKKRKEKLTHRIYRAYFHRGDPDEGNQQGRRKKKETRDGLTSWRKEVCFARAKAHYVWKKMLENETKNKEREEYLRKKDPEMMEERKEERRLRELEINQRHLQQMKMLEAMLNAKK